MPQRTLVVMRHAKAEVGAGSDHARRLTDQGVVDATAAGRWLAGQGVTPDLAVVSDATRTRETWAAVRTGAGWEVDAAAYDAGLYAASTATALDVLRETPEDLTTLMLLGHNPTVADLVQLLDDGEGDAEAETRLAVGYPTSAVTLLAYDGDWRELDAASAVVTALWTPQRP